MNILNPQSFRQRRIPQSGTILNPRRGQATLSLVLLIGGIVAVIGVTVAFLAFSFLSSGYGFQVSEEALAAASGGVQDGLIQLIRNKDFSSGGYTVPLGTTSAVVSVMQGSPSTGLVTVISQATLRGYSRKVRAVVSVVSSTGEVFLVTSHQLVL